MTRETSKWLSWVPETLMNASDKTDKTTSVGFVSRRPRPFQGEIADQSSGEAMACAIARLAEMTPDDLVDRIDRDRKLSQERCRLDQISLNSVAAVEAWFNGWRILIAEVLIDAANGNERECRSKVERIRG